jgi:hypothetical protein
MGKQELHAFQRENLKRVGRPIPNNKMNLKKIRCKGVEWVKLAENMAQ